MWGLLNWQESGAVWTAVFLLHYRANMPGLNHRTFLAQGLGVPQGLSFKALSACHICSAARCSSMHCICFRHVDMEALSMTHTGPDKPTIDVCLFCGGMNLLTIPSDCLGNICNIYFLLSEAQKWRNTLLGWLKTVPLYYFGNLFWIFHYFHCNDSTLLWVLLLTHTACGSHSAKQKSFIIFF